MAHLEWLLATNCAIGVRLAEVDQQIDTFHYIGDLALEKGTPVINVACVHTKVCQQVLISDQRKEAPVQFWQKW